MTEFFYIALSFPTVFFTVMLIVALSYWLFVILGFLDIDLFDFDVDIDLEGAVDGAIDGAADGAIDAAVDGAADGAIEGAAEGGASLVGTILSLLSIGKVPITITLSFIALFGWITSFSAFYGTTTMLELDPGLGIRLALFFGSFTASLVLAGVCVRPLRGAFEIVTRHGQETLIGQVCIVSTGTVDEKFGQASLADGGAGLNLSVRCDTPNTIERGDKVLIIGYNRDDATYLVEPYDTMLTDNTTLEAALAAEEHITVSEQTVSGGEV